MKKISESIWANTIKRSNTEEVRTEDAYTPEDVIDFGGSVLWSARSLEIDGNNRFSYEEIHNFNNNGWRLPTVEEVKEIGINKGERLECCHMNNDFRIRIWKKGTLLISDPDWKINGGFTCMTSEKDGNSIWTYGCNNSYKFKIESFSDYKPGFYVFLVKNK